MSSKTTLGISLLIWGAIQSASPTLQASDATIPREMESLKKLCLRIKVVDEQTGRGVPLIELKTTNQVSYFTDSHGANTFVDNIGMDNGPLGSYFTTDKDGITRPQGSAWNVGAYE